jgi:hypothetical protein
MDSNLNTRKTVGKLVAFTALLIAAPGTLCTALFSIMMGSLLLIYIGLSVILAIFGWSE